MKNYSKSALQGANKKMTIVLALILAIIIAGSVVLGVGFGVYGTDASKWFKATEEPQVDKNFVASVQNARGIRLLSEPATVASNGQTSVTIRVTLNPADATDALEWTIAGNEDEAITLEVAGDGLSATVTCNKAFDVQKTVTVTSKANTAVTGTCILDYYKRLESVSIKGLTTLALNNTATSYKVELEPHYGIGTILDTTVTISGGTVECINQINANSTTTWSDMIANAQGTVAIDTEGNFSLILSPNEKSSFFNIDKGAEAPGLISAFYKVFLSNCRLYRTLPQYRISVNWYATRQGGTFNTGTATVEGMFDVSALDVPAEDMSLSQDNILF